ncbi:MAG TPA: serine hydrolase domain-containing protein, partial [Gemmatimonadales bacterium]|nr:serine hydrolase domain-containing protein [Gemmatimonadales bacterium]
MYRSLTLSAALLLAAVVPDAAARPDPAVEAEVRAVETSLPAVRLEGRAEADLPLQGWMEALDIPGLSLAVIEGANVVWARGYGVLASGGEELVTAETLFQSASISKPLTALALLHHAERGVFDLDAPVNDYLESWQVRTQAGAVGQDVTLRQLLAHTAAITPGGFPGYPEGELLPSLAEILDGVPPATNPPARVVGQPGVQVQYSGLGFEIIELALTERLGRPFPEILDGSLFQPLRLAATTTELVPAPPRGGIALGHDVDGAVLAGGWHRYPETAAAGIWSTPTELGRVLIEVHRALRGESDRVISQATAAQMLSEVIDGEGLSWVLHLSGGALAGFSHSGGNAGFRAHVRMLPETGQGVVLMTNSDNG